MKSIICDNLFYYLYRFVSLFLFYYLLIHHTTRHMKKSSLFLFAFLILFLNSCEIYHGDVIVKTMDVTDIICNSATFHGKLKYNESHGSDFESGFELSETETFNDNSTTIFKVGIWPGDNGYDLLTYTASCSLKPGHKYYVRAFFYNLQLYHYGNVKTFTTPTFSPEYVDLGLSVKWATCNLGALSAEDFGDYFAWGETEPYYESGSAHSENPIWKVGKENGYSWNTYKYCKGSSSTMTKYCFQSEMGYNGFTDSKTILAPDDDAAHVIWGGDWRMPTTDEFTELFLNCYPSWTTINGVNGYKFVSYKPGYEGNSIFLPAAGERDDVYIKDRGYFLAGKAGYYWSSSLSSLSSWTALERVFDSKGKHMVIGHQRVSGYSIRPVHP